MKSIMIMIMIMTNLKQNQRRTPDGGGWINMKNKIDHCSGSCCPFDMKICVSKSSWATRSL